MQSCKYGIEADRRVPTKQIAEQAAGGLNGGYIVERRAPAEQIAQEAGGEENGPIMEVDGR